MIERTLIELRTALAAAGVRGHAAHRLVDEAREHLRDAAAVDGEEAAVYRFGPPADVARAAAAELATSRSLAAAYGVFAALAAVGLATLGAFAATGTGAGSPDITGGASPALGFAATLGLVLFPQVAFVAGCLAVLRARRLHQREAGAAELRVLRARAAVALAAGALTLASWALWAHEFAAFYADERAWLPKTLLVAAAVLALPLAAAFVALLRASRPQPSADGRADDLFDDLPPLRRLGLARNGWLLPAATALTVGLAVGVVGWAADGDPGSGLARGVPEAVLLLACYAVLARPLALRRLHA